MTKEQEEIFNHEANKCFDVLEKNTNWTVGREPCNTNDENTVVYEIRTSSPAGQDVLENIYINKNDFMENLECFPDRDDNFGTLFAEGIENAWEDYDPSEEASLWLDETGHGKNGAPYKMRDVLRDMEWVEKELEKTYKTLNRIYAEHERNKEKDVSPESIGKEFFKKYEKNLSDEEKLIQSSENHFQLMNMTRNDVLAFEKGDEKKRSEALNEFLSKLGVKIPDFMMQHDGVHITDKEIKETEIIVDNTLEKIIQKRKEKAMSINANAVDVKPHFDIKKITSKQIEPKANEYEREL